MSINDLLSILMFVSFIGLILTGFPVAWVLGGLSIVFTVIAIVLDIDLGFTLGVDWAYASLSVNRVWDVMKNWVLVALPLFIFMGMMLEHSGIASDLMNNLSRVFGRVRGGLAISVTIIGVLLAATTGIIGASVVLLALLGLPVMLANGYRPSLATGTVCAVGTLGILIPPSIMLVLMADRLAMPVGDLFLGAMVPGLILGALYIFYLLMISRLDKRAAPVPADAEPVSVAALLGVFRAVLAPVGLILAVLGSIFFGLATPTEAAGVGAFGAMLLALLRKRLKLSVLTDVLQQTTTTTAFIFAIFVGATAYSLVLRGLGGDELIESALFGLPFGPTGVVITILFLTFLLGFFLDWIEISLIILPLVAPVVQSLGFDLVWFTVMFAVCLQTSFLTPPVGFAIFYLKGVAPEDIDVRTIYRGVLPFILLQLLGLALIFIWKPLVTWLPSQAY
ncbi:MAG: TRAP transporter large permease subunit [Xanthomonadales bacterium]|nr:TRAP transporter large permease subunit [Gammaproteobacteria bacterium]NNK50064.1 TRAP transporter large permease subunit [Xanthomonadales bacterium]